jgi:anti-sigma factor (TIGR02949 family)
MMNPMSCQRLEDFLNHDLSGEDRARFLQHLPACPACRQGVDEEERLRGLLSRSVEQQPIPGRLLRRVDQARRMRRLRALRWVMGIAALLVIAVLGWWGLQRTNPEELATPVAKISPPGPPPPQEGPAVPPVEVVVKPEQSVIAIQHETDDPNVTLIWVYSGIGGDPGEE